MASEYAAAFCNVLFEKAAREVDAWNGLRGQRIGEAQLPGPPHGIARRLAAIGNIVVREGVTEETRSRYAREVAERNAWTRKHGLPHGHALALLEAR